MRSDVLFAATPLPQRHFKNIFKKDSIYLPENGILKMERSEPIHWDDTEQLELIWVGAICYRKALCIMLDSLALMSDTDRAKIHLNVVGNGALKEKMKRFVDEKKLPVTFYGSLSRAEVQRVFMKSHLHVITSIGDATTTVLWEAMSKAIPTLTLDHCGMAGVVCQKCGIKIPICSYNKTVESISNAIHAIIHTPDIIRQLSVGCLMCAKDFMWDKRIEVFNKAYDDAITHYHSN